jgi:hypothetical protein
MQHTIVRNVSRMISTVLVVIIAGMWHTAVAQTDTLTIESTAGAPGQLQLANISLTNTQQIAGLQLTLKMDAKTVIIDTVNTTVRTDGMMVQWNAQNGKILMIDFALKNMIDPGDGPILSIRYYVASTAAAKAVKIAAEGVVLSNPDGRAVPVIVENGQFVINASSTPDHKPD